MIAAALALIKGLSWQTWLVVALGATALGVYAEKTGHIKLLEHELTSVTKDRDGLKNEIAMARDLAVKTEADNKAKELKAQAEQKENDNEAQRLVARARNDARAAVDSHDRLLERALASSRQAAVSASAPASSPSACGSGVVLTGVLGRIDEAAGQLASYADQTRIALDACIGDYNAVVDSYGDH